MSGSLPEAKPMKANTLTSDVASLIKAALGNGLPVHSFSKNSKFVHIAKSAATDNDDDGLNSKR